MTCLVNKVSPPVFIFPTNTWRTHYDSDSTACGKRLSAGPYGHQRLYSARKVERAYEKRWIRAMVSVRIKFGYIGIRSEGIRPLIFSYHPQQTNITTS